jgi:hypothetical protein
MSTIAALKVTQILRESVNAITFELHEKQCGEKIVTGAFLGV